VQIRQMQNTRPVERSWEGAELEADRADLIALRFVYPSSWTRALQFETVVGQLRPQSISTIHRSARPEIPQ
jgi:hypothetical protein